MFASQPGSMHSYRRYSSLIAQFTMQFPGKKNPPLGVIFDSAMGRTIDDVLALAFLHGLTAKPEPEVRVVSVTVSHGNLRAAAFCDAMAWFFTGLETAQAAEEIPSSKTGPSRRVADRRRIAAGCADAHGRALASRPFR